MNAEAKAKLEAASKDADRGAEDIERLKAELARREDEIERVRLELDGIKNRPSTLGSTTLRSSGHQSSEPPSYVSFPLLDRDDSLTQHLSSSPMMYIGSTLGDNQEDSLPSFRTRAFPASRVDDENESDNPFGPPSVVTSPNSFLESIQQHLTDDRVMPKTPVSYSVCSLSYSSLVLTRTRFLEIPRILTEHARRSQYWNNRSLRRQKSQGARSSTVIPWGLM